MQLRCSNCHRPFALSKEAVSSALDYVFAEDLNHYNAQCPHCRRVNRVAKKQLRRAAPNWTPQEATANSEESADA